VFDGRLRRPYREDDPPAPLDAYGRSKVEGEAAITASGCAAIVMRTSWIFGLTGNNFPRAIMRVAADRDELSLVDDQQGSPTWSRTIAAATLQLQNSSSWPRVSGLYHVTASGYTTWFGFASAILAQATDMARRPRLTPIGSVDYPLPVLRPAWSVLDTTKFQTRFGIVLPRWQDTLSQCLADVPMQ
jgi:dTDP-4-dehydrorhamnose reductase